VGLGVGVNVELGVGVGLGIGVDVWLNVCVGLIVSVGPELEIVEPHPVSSTMTGVMMSILLKSTLNKVLENIKSLLYKEVHFNWGTTSLAPRNNTSK
jgi:hypothetical protein